MNKDESDGQVVHDAASAKHRKSTEEVEDEEEEEASEESEKPVVPKLKVKKLTPEAAKP